MDEEISVPGRILRLVVLITQVPFLIAAKVIYSSCKFFRRKRINKT